MGRRRKPKEKPCEVWACEYGNAGVEERDGLAVCQAHAAQWDRSVRR